MLFSERCAQLPIAKRIEHFAIVLEHGPKTGATYVEFDRIVIHVNGDVVLDAVDPRRPVKRMMYVVAVFVGWVF